MLYVDAERVGVLAFNTASHVAASVEYLRALANEAYMLLQ